MTELSAATQLSGMFEEYALTLGGKAWHERVIDGVSIARCVEMMGGMAVTSQTFRSKQLWAPNREPLETVYALSEVELRTIDTLPEEVSRLYEDDDNKPGETYEDDEKQMLSVSETTMYALFVHPEPSTDPYRLQITQEVAYNSNGLPFCMGTVLGGQAIFDADARAVGHVTAAGRGFEVVEYFSPDADVSEPEQDDLEAMLLGGEVLDPVERRVRRMVTIFDMLRPAA